MTLDGVKRARSYALGYVYVGMQMVGIQASNQKACDIWIVEDEGDSRLWVEVAC